MIKRFVPLLALALLAVPLTASAQAQQLKIGFTDLELLITNMPKFQQVQQQLQQEVVSGQEEIQQMEQQLQTKFEQYQKQLQLGLLTDEARTKREQELVTAQEELQRAAMSKEQELGERRAQLTQPILDELQTAIDAVAQQKGLDLVLRTQIGFEPTVLYVNPDRITDITLDVARRVGIEVDEDASTASSN